MAKKGKAFTLTELLVVVVIIGVLAAVVLPKFSKMIEARKTTEAEEMMTAVRNEQEARCTIGKNYQGDLTQLGVYKESKNFDYSGKVQAFDGENKIIGIIASAKNKDYSLEIPSYADGRICCSGSGCADLGKDYPSCDKLTHTSNYVGAKGDCGATVPPCTGAGCTPDPEPNPCDEPTSSKPADETLTNENGCTYTRTYTEWNKATCEWDWEDGDPNCGGSCDPTKKPQDLKQACEVFGYMGQNCGERTKGYYCNAFTGYTWKPKAHWGKCEATDSCKTPCKNGAKEEAECNTCGHKTRECINHVWGEWSKCDKQETECDCDPAKKPAETEDCGCNGQRIRTVDCWKEKKVWVTGDWGSCEGSECEEDCKGTPKEEQQCRPNDKKFDGDYADNECLIKVTNTELQQANDEVGLIEEYGESTTGGTTQWAQGYDKKINLGYTCDEYCKWRKNPCPSYGTGGGGSGGGMHRLEGDEQETPYVPSDHVTIPQGTPCFSVSFSLTEKAWFCKIDGEIVHVLGK